MQNCILNSLKIKTALIFLLLWTCPSLAAPSPLDDIHTKLYGQDPLHPSEGSLLFKYINETSAQTVIRNFPKTPNAKPDEVGVQKLVVAVSPETFKNFLSYFHTKNFLYAISLINSDHIQIAYQGKAALYSPPLKDNLGFTHEGQMMIPLLFDDAEGDRISTFMDVTGQVGMNWSNRDSIFYPQNIKTLSGAPFFPMEPFWNSCAAWFANLPVGQQLVDTYYFPSGNDNSPALTQKLEDYKMPDDESDARTHQIWKVPGHQQLGQMLNPDALRRGEFHNGGWIVYTLLGSTDNDRTPVVFLQVNDETKPIAPDFPLQIRVSRLRR